MPRIEIKQAIGPRLPPEGWEWTFHYLFGFSLHGGRVKTTVRSLFHPTGRPPRDYSIDHLHRSDAACKARLHSLSLYSDLQYVLDTYLQYHKWRTTPPFLQLDRCPYCSLPWETFTIWPITCRHLA